MQTTAFRSMFRSLGAALRRAAQAWAAQRARAAHQRRMASELMAMSEREMLDLAIGRGEVAGWLQAPAAPGAEPAAPTQRTGPQPRAVAAGGA